MSSKIKEQPTLKENEFLDKRGRKWEKFCDQSYFDMICVRCLDVPKDFNSPLSFHFMHDQQAHDFANLIKEAR